MPLNGGFYDDVRFSYLFDDGVTLISLFVWNIYTRGEFFYVIRRCLQRVLI